MTATLQIGCAFLNNLSDNEPRMRVLCLLEEEENLFKSHYNFQFQCENHLW